MNISKHVSLHEATFSQTAYTEGIENTPNPDQLANIQALCENIFEPLREWVGGPIQINSVFRGPELNAAIRGASKTSQHCANNGAAMDIDDKYFRVGVTSKNNADMFYFIKNNLEFDQLIWEFEDPDSTPEKPCPKWVHVSFRRDGQNRGQILHATKKNGRVSYPLWTE